MIGQSGQRPQIDIEGAATTARLVKQWAEAGTAYQENP